MERNTSVTFNGRTIRDAASSCPKSMGDAWWETMAKYERQAVREVSTASTRGGRRSTLRRWALRMSTQSSDNLGHLPEAAVEFGKCSRLKFNRPVARDAATGTVERRRGSTTAKVNAAMAW